MAAAVGERASKGIRVRIVSERAWNCDSTHGSGKNARSRRTLGLKSMRQLFSVFDKKGRGGGEITISHPRTAASGTQYPRSRLSCIEGATCGPPPPRHYKFNPLFNGVAHRRRTSSRFIPSEFVCVEKEERGGGGFERKKR